MIQVDNVLTMKKTDLITVAKYKNEDGCIRFEEDEEDSGYYEVEMLLSKLGRYDSGAKVMLP